MPLIAVVILLVVWVSVNRDRPRVSGNVVLSRMTASAGYVVAEKVLPSQFK